MEPSSLTYTFYAQLILTGGSAAAQDEAAGGGRGAGDELWRGDRSDGGRGRGTPAPTGARPTRFARLLCSLIGRGSRAG